MGLNEDRQHDTVIPVCITEHHAMQILTARQHWNDDADPENPFNWPSSRKWINVGIISSQATLSPIASTILAIAAAEIGRDFELTDSYTPALPTGLYVLGLGLGPLLLAPCSELYGRRIVYICSSFAFTILNVGCALANNVAALSILRLLTGVAGSAGPSLGAASIGDMFVAKDRGRAQSLYSFGPVMGPVIGGVIGGFVLAHTHRWSWLMWIVAIAAGVITALSALLLRETYGPYILSRRTDNRMNEQPGMVLNTSPSLNKKLLFGRAIGRPIRLLFTSPICAFMSIYLSMFVEIFTLPGFLFVANISRIYGILYLHLITILLLFGPTEMHGLFTYKWTNGTTGLAYLGAGSGSLIGMFITAKFMNRSFVAGLARQEQRTGSSLPNPELRIPFLQLGMIITPIGLIVFAWSAAHTHWIVPLLGACIFGAGMLMAYVCIHTYLVDCFTEWSASAIAAAVVTRCTIGCVFCVVGFELYKKLGYSW
jgi:multidrug resistance protein